MPGGYGAMSSALVRPAAAAGMGLLAIYYFAYPPLFSPAMGGSLEGS